MGNGLRSRRSYRQVFLHLSIFFALAGVRAGVADEGKCSTTITALPNAVLLPSNQLGKLTFNPNIYAIGHEGSGGGDAEVSTPAQVGQAIDDLLPYAFNFWGDEYRLDLITPENISDPELKLAAARIFGEPHRISQAKTTAAHQELGIRIKEVLMDGPNPNVSGPQPTIHPIASGVCTGDESEGDVDASTLHERAAPICISVERLTRVPPTALNSELLGLFFHELAHQYGYGESTARKIQFLVLRTLPLVEIAQEVSDLSRSLANAQSSHSPAYLCSQIGYISGLISTRMNTANLDPQDLTPQDLLVLRHSGGVLATLDKRSIIPAVVLAKEVASRSCNDQFNPAYLSIGLKLIRSALDNQ